MASNAQFTIRALFSYQKCMPEGILSKVAYWIYDFDFDSSGAFGIFFYVCAKLIHYPELSNFKTCLRPGKKLQSHS
jgi:hypothetical protein